MVRLDNRLEKIKENFVDYGSYFVINKGRQYGKTTTRRALEEYLKEYYIILSLDFQQLGIEDFADAATFAKAFAEVVLQTFDIMGISSEEEFLQPLIELTKKTEERNLKALFFALSKMCAKALRPMVLMIDEVDSASNKR